MSFHTENSGPEVSSRDARAVIREKLLEIVGFNFRNSDRVRSNGLELLVPLLGLQTALLFNRRIELLDLYGLLESIRFASADVIVVHLDRGAKGNDPRCEFGGQSRARDRSESPVANAAAEHWRSLERSFAVARAINRICVAHLAEPPRTV